MEHNKLKSLAEKYWEGETNELEESQLRDTLSSGDVPAGLEPLADYFDFTDRSGQMVLGEDFDSELLNSIEQPKARLIRIPMVLRAAAAVVLLFVATMIFRNYNQTELVADADQTEFIDTYDNPEEAYREVKKAMMMVSRNMEEGIRYTEMLSEFDRVASTPRKK